MCISSKSIIEIQIPSSNDYVLFSNMPLLLASDV